MPRSVLSTALLFYMFCLLLLRSSCCLLKRFFVELSELVERLRARDDSVRGSLLYCSPRVAVLVSILKICLSDVLSSIEWFGSTLRLPWNVAVWF